MMLAVLAQTMTAAPVGELAGKVQQYADLAVAVVIALVGAVTALGIALAKLRAAGAQVATQWTALKAMAKSVQPLVEALPPEDQKKTRTEMRAMVIDEAGERVHAIVNKAVDEVKLEAAEEKRRSSGSIQSPPPLCWLLLMILLPLVGGCCADIHAEVVKLRQTHAIYRAHSQAKLVTETAQVEALGAAMEESFSKLDKLTN